MKHIPVTIPFLPPLKEYQALIGEIWERRWLTNNGPLVKQLEDEIKQFLEVKNLWLTSNGTIAIQIAIKALGLEGKIITTPFSYVATTSSIVWENCEPTFVDIDPDSLNIDPRKIEDSITEKTSAILATHVFGNPCDVDKIQEVANKYGLKIIYDAAHAFGVRINDNSVFEYGDISTTSFHATKLFHTIEGGAVISKSTKVSKKMRLMRNFGHSGPYEFDGVGINGKNSEAHAAMGLCNIKYLDEIIDKRKKICETYDSLLFPSMLQKQYVSKEVDYNFAYYPIILPSEPILLKVEKSLAENNIYTRRYFYPSLDKLPYVFSKQMEISNDIASRILCLPLYYELEFDDVSRIALTILKNLS